MDIIELTQNGLEKIGAWNVTEGVNMSRPELPGLGGEEDSLHNKSFVVLTSLVSFLLLIPQPRTDNESKNGLIYVFAHFPDRSLWNAQGF